VKTQTENPPRATDEPVDVVISFASRSGPLAGTVDGAPSCSARTFHGWLELMDAVECLRAGVAPEGEAR
jgi:hypothetical protein